MGRCRTGLEIDERPHGDVVSPLTRRALLLTGAAFCVAHTQAQAQTTPPPAQTASTDVAIAKASVPVEPVDVGAVIENQMQDYITQSGLTPRQARGELWVVSGTAPVAVPASNPDWVKYRMAAYMQALLDTEADYVAAQNLRLQTTTVRDFYKAAGDDVPPYVDPKLPGAASELIRKLLAAGSGQLDAKLRELGIDPKDYEKAPDAQRTALLRDHINTTVLKHSLADVVGLIPLQTFEGQDGAGNYQIGVVGVVSPKMRDLADQLLKARGQFTPEPAKAQDLSKVTADKPGLLHQFGLRWLYDEQGLPVIISFAQWASSYRGPDPSIAATYRDAARHQAEALADGQIADFLKATVVYDQATKAGVELDRTAAALPDSATISDTKTALDEMRRRIVRVATVNVTGIRTLTTWTGRHPLSGQPIIVVVRMWSAAGEQAAHALQASHRVGQPSNPTAPTPDVAAGVTQGNSLMKASDF
jgi:hypothetical protein